MSLTITRNLECHPPRPAAPLQGHAMHQASALSYGRLREGIEAVHSRRIEEARAILRSVVADRPNDERAWLWLATVADGNDEMRACLERVLAINPDHPRAYGWLHQLLAYTRPSMIDS